MACGELLSESRGCGAGCPSLVRVRTPAAAAARNVGEQPDGVSRALGQNLRRNRRRVGPDLDAEFAAHRREALCHDIRGLRGRSLTHQLPGQIGEPDFVLALVHVAAATTRRIATFGTWPNGTIVTGRPLSSVNRRAAGRTKSFGVPALGGFCFCAPCCGGQG